MTPTCSHWWPRTSWPSPTCSTRPPGSSGTRRRACRRTARCGSSLTTSPRAACTSTSAPASKGAASRPPTWTGHTDRVPPCAARPGTWRSCSAAGSCQPGGSKTSSPSPDPPGPAPVTASAHPDADAFMTGLRVSWPPVHDGRGRTLSGAGERQLDLEHLLIDVGDIVDLVDPYLAARRAAVVALRLDPPGQIVVHEGEDAGRMAVAYGGGRLDLRQHHVLRGRR